MSELSSFTPIDDSPCVRTVRRRVRRKKDITQHIPLRNIAFGTLAGSESGGWWGLRDTVSRRIAGEVIWCRTYTGATDPVHRYICVGLSSGLVLESIEFASAPETAHFFAAGARFGRMVEQQLPEDPSWWRRFFFGKRAWQVFLHDTMIGSVELQYPLSKKTRLLLQLSGGTSLPIGLACVWFRKSTRFVIPPDTPEVSEPDLEMLHFLLVIVFRILLGLDFGGD